MFYVALTVPICLLCFSDTYYMIEYWVNGDSKTQILSADRPYERTVFNIDNYLNLTLLQIYCSWASFSAEGDRTNCTVKTESPTPAPTDIPSTPPTPAPTDIPSVSPTKNPSMEPTAAPTYHFNDVTKCDAVFDIKTQIVDNIDTAVITWEALPVDDNDPSIPPSNWINYKWIIGNNFKEDNRKHLDNFITCNATNYCQGRATTVLCDQGAGGCTYDDTITQVQFYAEYTVK